MEEYKLNRLKYLLPSSLFSRALLILVLPILIMQTVAIYVFYIEHWENVERHFSFSLAGDIAFIVEVTKHSNEQEKRELERMADRYMHIEISKKPNDSVLGHFPSITDDTVFKTFSAQLRDNIDEPFMLQHSPGDGKVILLIKMKDSVLCLKFSTKRLVSVNAMLFILWMIGPAILLLIIATIFLRNQIRPIIKLAEVAEKFGKGQYDIEFRPQGASEVRLAGRSFLAMRERLKRIISARTEMLASISHDLRTPLTRMRLALAMLPEQKYIKPLLADVQDMEKMIQEYLDFARGKGGEQAKQVNISFLLNDVSGKYITQGKNVKINTQSEAYVTIFYNAMCRCLNNVIDNALRYGNRCDISVEEFPGHIEIILDDDGTGIPPEQRELAMQPFKRIDISRNLDTSGAGLGLSIVQDIILRHGGEVTLEDAPIGGLRVRLSIPA